jgi:hypothetical protein
MYSRVLAGCVMIGVAGLGCSLLVNDGAYQVADASVDAGTDVIGPDVGPDHNPILGQQCPPATDVNPCYLCEDAYCCNTYNNCHNDPECDAYKACLLDCENEGGTTCDVECANQHIQGVADWAQREACIFVYCLTQCTTGTPDPCVACTVSNCPEEYVDSEGTIDGYLLGDCVATCNGSAGCIDACYTEFPTAADAEKALEACVVQNCTTKC